MRHSKLLQAMFWMLILASPLCAEDKHQEEIPQVPNFITLISLLFPYSAVAQWLHHWESIIFSILIGSLILLFFYVGLKQRALIPGGFQSSLEWLLENIHNFIIQILGPEGERFVPFLGTLFIYILFMNWFVLIPFMAAPSSNINVTVALAICVFCLVQYLNIKNRGILGYLHHMAGSPKSAVDWLLVPLLFPIELLTQLTRPFTLALRLFGNVFGEDILIGAFALFGVLAISVNLPVGLPLQIPFMFLAMLTGLMQALVFTLLSTIYILLSMPHEGE